MGTTLTVYRGEKKQWWPSPDIRLMSGMTLYAPWPGNVGSLWAKLQQEIGRQFGVSVAKKVAAYGQYLRASGHPFALATAWTDVGSFTSDYNYVIKIPSARLFYWGGTNDKPDLGAEAQISGPTQVRQDFIVLNAGTVGGSTILGFGHNTATKEITFFHDLPLTMIESCNGTTPTQLGIKKKADLSFDEKVRYGKFIR